MESDKDRENRDAQPRARKSIDPADPPRTREDLHKLVRDHVGISIATAAMIDGHTAPFEYLCHTFFEGLGGWPQGGDGADAQGPDPRDSPDCVVWANRGGGKTFLGALATALDLVYKPGIQIRILAGSLEQAGRMQQHLHAIFQKPEFRKFLDGDVTQRQVRLKNESVVQLLAQSQASVRGTRIQKLRCDEVELFHPHVWEAAQLTTRSAQCGSIYIRGAIECFSTMHNPHGLMRRLVGETRDGRRRLFKWGVLDVLERCSDRYCCDGRAEGNAPARPCVLLPECQRRAKESGREGHITIDDALRMKGRIPLPVWESEMLCLRPRRTDAVLPEFDARVHVVDTQPPEREVSRWVGGVDFGYRNPTVILWAAVDLLGRLWVVDECITRQALLQQHIETIVSARWPRLEWIGVDPAGAQVNGQTGRSNIALMRQAGLHLRFRQIGIHEGVLLIRARLKPADGSGPRLLIHKRCRELIEAMESYHYDTQHPESETPLKDGADHAADALRYMIANLDRHHQTRIERY